MSEEEPKWITEPEEISTASNQSLRRALITCDGKGEKFKEAVLNELISRAEQQLYQNIRNNA